MGAPLWSQHDEDAVMTHYPSGGAYAVLKHLHTPRAINAIQGKAKRMGVAKKEDFKRKEITLSLLREIKKAYASGQRGALKALAERHQVNYSWLKSLASTHGISRGKYYRWTKDADRIITDNEGFCPQTIRQRLAAAGYFHPTSAVAKRMGQLRVTHCADDEFSPQQIAEILGICRRRLNRFIKSGALKTRCHYTARGVPSGHDYITAAALRQFIQQNPGEIDLRRLEPSFHVWFIDLLTNRAAETVK